MVEGELGLNERGYEGYVDASGGESRWSGEQARAFSPLSCGCFASLSSSVRLWRSPKIEHNAGDKIEAFRGRGGRINNEQQ